MRLNDRIHDGEAEAGYRAGNFIGFVLLAYRAPCGAILVVAGRVGLNQAAQMAVLATTSIRRNRKGSRCPSARRGADGASVTK